MSIRKAVFIHCQRNENPCSNQEIHVLFEHGSEFYNTYRRMAENGFAPPTREFRRHILSCRELKAESFKTCLHSARWGVSL